MELSEHLQNTNGKGEDIHKFLDQFQKQCGLEHRIILHNKKGIEIAVNLFGESARSIAISHLEDDFYGTGIRPIPNSFLEFEHYTIKNLENFKKAIKIAVQVNNGTYPFEMTHG